MTDLTLF